MVHILTHNDLDGYSAGYVALQHFGATNCDIEYFNYDKEPCIEDYGEGDIVVITDYSLSNDQYRQILSKIGDDGHLIWCDHHITAINRYHEDEDVCCEGLRSTKYCGAVLTYLYFQDYDTEDVETMDYTELMSHVPYWLRVVDAWDTWKLNVPYREDAEYLNMGIGMNLSMENIDDMIRHIQKWVALGQHYTKFRDNWSKQFRDKYMFYKHIPGKNFGVNRTIKTAVLNLGCGNSLYFGDVIDDVDVCVTMCFNGEHWIVSLYSNKPDIDCSICAKYFGGGGHKGAAGCTINQLTPPMFILGDDEEILVKEKKENGKV